MLKNLKVIIMKDHLLLLLFSFSILICACGGSQRPPADEITDPMVLLNAMNANENEIRTLRASSSIEYYGEEGRVRLTQAMAIRAPNDLRIETISPFDTTLNLLVSNQNELVLLDMENSAMYVGAPTAENIHHIFPIPMSPSDLVLLLLGGAPIDGISDDPTEYSIQWDRQESAYRLLLPLENGDSIELFIAHETWQVQGGEGFDNEHHRLYRFTMSNRRLEANLPATIRFLLDENNTDVSIDIESVTVNPTLPDLLFELSPSPGISVHSF